MTAWFQKIKHKIRSNWATGFNSLLENKGRGRYWTFVKRNSVLIFNGSSRNNRRLDKPETNNTKGLDAFVVKNTNYWLAWDSKFTDFQSREK